MSAVPLIFSSGWASGINSYAVVLLLGLLGRYAHMSAVPPTLERADVLAVCAVLFIGQFVVGKIPYVDSVWDAIHTAVRPLMGAAIGALMAGHTHALPTAVAAVIGGGAALATHLVKTGVRVGVNASPEPVSNVAASLSEDAGVAGVTVLGLLHPLVAALIAAILLVVGVTLVIMMAKRIRRAWRRRRERRRERRPQLS